MRKLISLIGAMVVGTALLAVPAAAAPTSITVGVDVLSTDTSDPISVAVTPDGRIVWGEREGEVNVLLPDGTQVKSPRLPVSADDCNGVTAIFFPVDGNLGPAKPARDPLIDAGLVDACHSSWDDPAGGLNEGGLMSVLLTADFETSNRIYLSWSVPSTYDEATRTGEWRIATFVLDPDTNQIDLDSEEVIWSTRVEWDEFAHYGYDLEWLPDGTLLVSAGDDTTYTSNGGYGPRDWRDDTDNAEVTSQNPANHRGKLLRMMPDGSVPDGVTALPDGSVPAANPFLGQTMDNPNICLSETLDFGGDGAWDRYNDTCPDEGWPTIAYDPYIYTMGWKQPWRGAILPNGAAYYGEVAPDAGGDNGGRGRAGREEINYVPPGGGTNYGWPRCVGAAEDATGQGGNTHGYIDVNNATGETFGELSCDGFTDPTLWYGGSSGNPWGAMGSSGAKTSEPLVYYHAGITGDLRLPAELNGTVLMTEWNRQWLLGIPVDEDYRLITRDADGKPSDDAWFRLNASGWSGVLDATIGPDGALYAVKHGNSYRNNTGSQLIRVRCAECSDGLYGTGGAAVMGVIPTQGASPALAGAALMGLLGLAMIGRRRRQAMV